MTQSQVDLERRERPAFEQWAMANGFIVHRHPHEQLYMSLTNVAWKAWLARAAAGVTPMDSKAK